jgi:phenylpropionate dioxygenase-like ring-hydroxylating dioxygenase large terminal subunit
MTAALQAAPAPQGDGLPRGLPAWAYADARLTVLEHERVLMPSWQIACHAQSIPAPGDYMTFDIGPDSVVVLRDQAGAIHAYHNACRHRGARLVDGDGKCPGAITCPYHGWTYDLDGSLRGLPVRDSFPGLDRAAYGLKPVKTEIMLGFVFVCLKGDPIALS